MQFVFSKQNYKNTNKHIGFYFMRCFSVRQRKCGVFRCMRIKLVRSFNGEICAVHFPNQINFCEENVFFLCLFVQTSKGKCDIEKKEKKKKENVVYDRGRNMTDINAILLAFLVSI